MDTDLNIDMDMKESTTRIYEELFARYPVLDGTRDSVRDAFCLIRDTYTHGGCLFCGGNGGSACDCEHIVGELLKSFKKERAIDAETKERLLSLSCGDASVYDAAYVVRNLEGALPAVSLISQTGVLTAFSNDRAWDVALAQQVYGLGRAGDCLLVLSTSGNSQNCIYAAMVARAKGMRTVGLTGALGGALRSVCDVCICVPSTETYRVQELHLPVYHAICGMLEEELF